MALITAIVYGTLHYFCLQPLEVHDKKKMNRMIGGGSDQLKRAGSLSASKRRRQSAKDFEAAKDVEAC
jgi:hypothetical protein